MLEAICNAPQSTLPEQKSSHKKIDACLNQHFPDVFQRSSSLKLQSFSQFTDLAKVRFVEELEYVTSQKLKETLREVYAHAE